jgi:hypothetical protein
MSSNLTIYNDIKEPYVNYGLQHFLKKYNLSCVNDPQNADIYLSYLPPENCNARVKILFNTNAKDERCYLNINGEIIPTFKKSVETTGEYSLIEMTGENYNCLSIKDNCITVGFDIFAEIGRILGGYYDSFFLKRDEFGKILRGVPVVDALENVLFSAISRILPESSVIQRFTWPDNKKFALLLTHDVDRVYKTYQYLPSILKSIKEVNLSEFRYYLKNLMFKHCNQNPYWTFDTICKLENDLGLKSTYYFLNEKGKLNPFSLQSWILYRGYYDIDNPSIKESIRKLVKLGYEIGLHGSNNSYNNLELLQNEKRILESITGSDITGIRQHNLNYDNNVTSNIHDKVGLKYDTSIGFNPGIGIGFRRGTSFPFRVILPDLTISHVLEIPLIIMDGALDRGVTLNDCFNMIDQVEKYGGILTILWHTQRFNRNEYPGMVDIYEKIINEAKKRGAWLSSTDEVCKLILTENI